MRELFDFLLVVTLATTFILFVWMTLFKPQWGSIKVGHAVALFFTVTTYVLYQARRAILTGYFSSIEASGQLIFGWILGYFFPGGFLVAALTWIIRKVGRIKYQPDEKSSG